MTDWRDHAETLWGPDWGLALSDTLGVDRTTVRRWRNARQAEPEWLPPILEKLARFAGGGDEARAFGTTLRRIAMGEIPQTILAEHTMAQQAVAVVARILEDDIMLRARLTRDSGQQDRR